MKLGTVLAIVGLVLTLQIALQGATFSYVIAIERRITRLETLAEVQRIEPRRQVSPGGRPAARILAELPPRPVVLTRADAAPACPARSRSRQTCPPP
jgi:hypothetical protein